MRFLLLLTAFSGLLATSSAQAYDYWGYNPYRPRVFAPGAYRHPCYQSHFGPLGPWNNRTPFDPYATVTPYPRLPR